MSAYTQSTRSEGNAVKDHDLKYANHSLYKSIIQVFLHFKRLFHPAMPSYDVFTRITSHTRPAITPIHQYMKANKA